MSNHGIFAETYFWRTAQKQEIDYIEIRNGKVFAYEFKLNPKRKAKFSRTFLKSYKVEKTEVITPENFENFLTKL